MSDGDNLVLGQNNTSSNTTNVKQIGPVTALLVDSVNDNAIQGQAESGGAGVFGMSNLGPGIAGQSNNGPGVSGASNSANGVSGTSNRGTGVSGTSTSAVGVSGTSNNSQSAGVTGFCAGGFGVVGASPGTGGTGVFGESDNTGVTGQGGALGVYGLGQMGVRGESNDSAGVNAVTHESTAPFAGALNATATGSGGWAGVFNGGVLISGGLFTSAPTTSMIRHPDGSHRALYSLESPEGWFEDFGRFRVIGGKAKVRLDSRFTAIVHTKGYHVFLTPEGDSKGVYVRRMTGTGFEVREQGGGKRHSHVAIALSPGERSPSPNDLGRLHHLFRTSDCGVCKPPDSTLG